MKSEQNGSDFENRTCLATERFAKTPKSERSDFGRLLYLDCVLGKEVKQNWLLPVDIRLCETVPTPPIDIHRNRNEPGNKDRIN